jgi:hypothetical protein
MSSTLRTAASVFRRVSPISVLLFGRRDERRVEPTLDPACDTARGVDRAKLLAAARSAPDLAPIEWDGDRGVRLAWARPARPPNEWTAQVPDGDARARRIRDRYVRARFPGVVRDAADLHSVETVIKSARLYFEDGQADLAFELIDCALEENPRAEAVWLARLELVFLRRDAAGFAACARAFRDMHPASAAWEEVARLGRALSPGDGLFGPASGPREHDHYGPWPHTPNWIQASWDLTADVAAIDFHRAIVSRGDARGNDHA